MALAFDAVGPSAAGQTASSPTSVTWSHTCSGSQRVLVVGVAVGDVSSDATKTISGVTYAGVAMTSLGVKHANDASNGYLQVFALINPASGANNVVVSFAAAPSSAECGSLSFTGADQTTAWGTPVLAAGNTTLATAAVASNVNGNIIAFFTAGGSGFFANPTSPATVRWVANLDGNSGGGNGAGATIPATGSSVTCSWGLGADWWALIAVEIKVAAAGAPAFQGWGIPA